MIGRKLSRGFGVPSASTSFSASLSVYLFVQDYRNIPA